MDNQIKNVINPAAEQVAASIATPVIASFEFQDHPVRVVTIEGKEYFVAIDLAAPGLLDFKNARQAVRNYVSKKDRRGVLVGDTTGRMQTLLAVNESGFYALVFGSRKPKAQAVKNWVTAEVLPSLRRTGRYEIEQRLPALLAQIAEGLRGRGVAKERQVNRVVAHRDGTFSFRVGKHWAHHMQPLNVSSLSLGHSLREGVALSALHVAQRAEQRTQLH